MKAYILSVSRGAVQIGNTVFQPCTGSRFNVTPLINKKNYISVVVPDKSMSSALFALRSVDLQGRIIEKPINNYSFR